MKKYMPNGSNFRTSNFRPCDHTKPRIAPSMATANALHAEDRLDVVL